MLTLLANPLHVRILRAHEAGPLRATEVEEAAGWPAATTLRAAIGNLRRSGLLERQEVSAMPHGVATALTEAGREVLFVAGVVERWLAIPPQGPIPVDSEEAKGAVKALAAGWSTKILRALAARPASLTELAQRIPEVSYPSLERRLTRMRKIHQIEPSPTPGRGIPYEATDWLRHAIAPLCAAGRCERRHMRAETAPITPVEIEAAFLLAMELAPLPETTSGICKLVVLPEADEHGKREEVAPAGVTVEVENGIVLRCVPELQEEVPAWALGTPMDWLNAVIDGHLESLRFGDARPQLAADLVHGLHLGLFGD
ncbi:MAG TPA: winged helix-turn-helix transcriptional regulator [Solirubrobacterales bacterium]|nr:winged helix-turn-helix transcriptional regulator [Solirubrobacterales bacterium]